MSNVSLEVTHPLPPLPSQIVVYNMKQTIWNWISCFHILRSWLLHLGQYANRNEEIETSYKIDQQVLTTFA
jgi:hypothetical protein